MYNLFHIINSFLLTLWFIVILDFLRHIRAWLNGLAPPTDVKRHTSMHRFMFNQHLIYLPFHLTSAEGPRPLSEIIYCCWADCVKCSLAAKATEKNHSKQFCLDNETIERNLMQIARVNLNLYILGSERRWDVNENWKFFFAISCFLTPKKKEKSLFANRQKKLLTIFLVFLRVVFLGFRARLEINICGRRNDLKFTRHKRALPCFAFLVVLLHHSDDDDDSLSFFFTRNNVLGCIIKFHQTMVPLISFNNFHSLIRRDYDAEAQIPFQYPIELFSPLQS